MHSQNVACTHSEGGPSSANDAQQVSHLRDRLTQLQIDRSAAPFSVAAPGRTGLLRWISLGAVTIIGAAIAVWFLIGTRAQTIEVEVATAVPPAARQPPATILDATGYVTPRRQATVSTQITGTITEVLIEEGESVRQGQVLMRLDSSAQQAALSQARAQVKVSQAQLAQFQAQLAQALRELTRTEHLVAQHLLSEQAGDIARTAVDTLQSQVETQQRQVELALAAVQAANVQLDYTIVRAPFDGVIVAKTAQPGEIVSPMSAGGGFTRTGVGTIVDMNSLEITIDVNEAFIDRVRANLPATAVLDAYPEWPIPAHVIAKIPTAERAKATVKVRVAIDQKDDRIVPEMGARVRFHEEPITQATSSVDPSPSAVLIPSSAIVRRDGKHAIFAVDGDRATLQPIQVDQPIGNQQLVRGVASGTRIILTPPPDLQDQSRILVKAPTKS